MGSRPGSGPAVLLPIADVGLALRGVASSRFAHTGLQPFDRRSLLCRGTCSNTDCKCGCFQPNRKSCCSSSRPGWGACKPSITCVLETFFYREKELRGLSRSGGSPPAVATALSRASACRSSHSPSQAVKRDGVDLALPLPSAGCAGVTNDRDVYGYDVTLRASSEHRMLT